jgi:hypothetical protein
MQFHQLPLPRVQHGEPPQRVIEVRNVVRGLTRLNRYRVQRQRH